MAIIDDRSGVPVDRKAAWDAPANATIRQMPYYNLLYSNDSHSPSITTSVFGIVGPGAAFDPNRNVTLAECNDDLIFLMEAADSKTHWMQPGDYDVTKLLAANGQLGDHVKSILPHRIHVLFADGQVWTLSEETPMAAIKPFLTLAAAKSHDRDELLAKYRVD